MSNDLWIPCSKKLLEEHVANPLVIKHWQSIVDGKLPFGYKII